MAQILRFLIASSLAAGNKAFGPRRNNITQKDDVHGCRTFLCEGGATEFNGYMKTDVPRSDGRLYGLVEVYDTETKHRRAAQAGEVFALLNSAPTLSDTTEAAPASLAAGPSAPTDVASAGGTEAEGTDAESAAGSTLHDPGKASQEGAAGEVKTSSADVEGAPTLLERIEAAVADKAKTFAALADELNVDVSAVKDAVKGQEHLQTTGGWVKIVK